MGFLVGTLRENSRHKVYVQYCHSIVYSVNEMVDKMVDANSLVIYLYDSPFKGLSNGVLFIALSSAIVEIMAQREVPKIVFSQL
jgi:hypothetical protein